MLDSKKTLSIARLQYINALSDEAAKAFTTTYINFMTEEAKKTNDKFSFGNRSVVEKVFSTVVARELFEAYTYDLQPKKGANYLFFHATMESTPVLNPTVLQIWKYMHSEIIDENGAQIIQEMVVMDKLAYFYTEYLVDFAFIGICRKTCLPFIENLSNRSKLKCHNECHCSFNVSNEIYLDPLKWSAHDAPKDEPSMRTAYVKKLGIPFFKATNGNSVPRTFQHCMTALFYQSKTIEKLKYGDGDQIYWWNMFDLTKFANLFDTNAMKMILERRRVDADVKGEVSGEVSTNSSPKIKLYNSIIDRYNKSKPSEKNLQFQHAIYNLIVLKDDQATKGTAQINNDQGRLANILRSDEMPKLDKIFKIAKGTSQHAGNDSKHDDSKPSKSSNTYEDEYEEEETDEDILNATENAHDDDASGTSTSGDDENDIKNRDTVGDNDEVTATKLTTAKIKIAIGAAKEDVISANGENNTTMLVPATRINGEDSKDDTIVTTEQDVANVNGGIDDSAAPVHHNDKNRIDENTAAKGQIAIGAAKEDVTSVDGRNDAIMPVPPAKEDVTSVYGRNDAIMPVPATRINGKEDSKDDTIVTEEHDVTAAVAMDNKDDTIVAVEDKGTGVNGKSSDTIVHAHHNENDKIEELTAAEETNIEELTDAVSKVLAGNSGNGKTKAKKRSTSSANDLNISESDNKRRKE